MITMMVNAKLLAFDLQLYTSKWFDYRFMTPLAATMKYVEAFGKIYQAVFARERDVRIAQYIRPIQVSTLMAGLRNGETKYKRLLAGFWRGRQVADALGMPYELYIDLAFDYRLRHWNQRHLPRPEQLYHEFDVEKIQARWEELQSSRIYAAEHPAYTCESYADLPLQNDHHEWLFVQARRRSDEAGMLAEFVRRDLLPVEKVRARLSGDELDRFERNLI